ncbi:hypothetical protein RND71_019447 [Anisodus tanguticus]|uniref:Uncharacterized protein n=1 Tax=Anisodus tanguticus TaxID=243964 RepID=A0AAE1RZC7_9SOLA|nr:hypothetical protein RND71_019447 [Anisodus tanguticus]
MSSLIIEFVGMTAEAVGDAERLKQQENFTVLTPELPDSNDYTNSLGSWKDGADGQEPFDESLAPRNKSDSYKDGANGQEPLDEALTRRKKSDSYVGGGDRSSRPVKEAPRSKTLSSPRPAASLRMKMSWAEMDQEDDLDAEEISQWSNQLSNGNGVNKEETSIQETKTKTDLSREHREHIRFCNVKRKKDSFVWRGSMGKL